MCEMGTPAAPGNSSLLFRGLNRSDCYTGENETHFWEWYQCPDENECATGANLCGENATCVNLDNTDPLSNPRGYLCTCPPSLQLAENGLDCLPRCDAFGCVYGTCISQDECACDLGYFGRNCSIDCGCNFHSYCDEKGPGFCDECFNNTMGPTCSECVPGSHGNGTAGSAPYDGQCHLCYDVCNGHSTNCTTDRNTPGPVCQDCQDNTHGSFCEICDDGYFLEPHLQQSSFEACPGNLRTDNKACLERYLGSSVKIHATCTPCMCNGHSVLCDPINGEDCDCQNNTMTLFSTCDTTRVKNGSCYAMQCADCKDEVEIRPNYPVSLVGRPVNREMCYVFTPFDLLVERTIKGSEVHSYQSEPKPKYSNLNIQVIIEADKSSDIAVYLTYVNDSKQSSPGLGISFNQDATLNFTNLSPMGKVIVAKPNGFDERLVMPISFTSQNFVESKFFVHVQSLSKDPNDEVAYRLFYTQPRLDLNLVVFFTVFFSVFYLLIVVASYPVFLKASRMSRQLVQQEQQQMETMAQRPVASVRLVMSRCIPVLEEARAVADLIARKQLPLTPIAEQPLKNNENVKVASFVVELPSDSEYRNVCLGSALCVAPSESSRSRQTTNNSSPSSSSSRDVLQTAL